MPNELQKAYLDGAAMAYRDVAAKIKQMVNDAPSSIKGLMSCMEPLAESCMKKADGVYEEAERIETADRH